MRARARECADAARARTITSSYSVVRPTQTRYWNQAMARMPEPSSTSVARADAPLQISRRLLQSTRTRSEECKRRRMRTFQSAHYTLPFNEDFAKMRGPCDHVCSASIERTAAVLRTRLQSCKSLILWGHTERPGRSLEHNQDRRYEGGRRCAHDDWRLQLERSAARVEHV